MTAEIRLKAIAAPPASRFKGYVDVLVRYLRLAIDVIRYRRKRWKTPDGERLGAPPSV